MERTEKIPNYSEDRINDYLSSFKSGSAALHGAESAGAKALEEYLLERAAEELRVAKQRLDKIKQELEG